MTENRANSSEIYQREIRSYVVRSRTSKSQKRALKELKNQFAIEFNSDDELIDPSQFFQADQLPVALEIGFGMGENLLNNSEKLVDFNWIGVETHDAGVGRVLNFADKNAINRLKVYHGDVQILLNKLINQSLDWVQIFFPDPWPKKRHHKRRLISTPFIQLLQQKMKPGAKLEIATDWQNYAKQIESLFDRKDLSTATPDWFDQSFQSQRCPRSDNRVLTNFEKKAIRAQREVFDFSFIRQ